MSSDTDHELMDVAPTSALRYPTNLSRSHSSCSYLSALDDIPQGLGNQEVAEKSGKVRFTRLAVVGTHSVLLRQLGMKRGLFRSPQTQDLRCP